jgi:glycosyltransferase involved in cell wall biosynthesis
MLTKKPNIGIVTFPTGQGQNKKQGEDSINSKPKIVLVTGWWSKKNRSVFGTSLKLIDLLKPLSTKITWIVTNPSNERPLDDRIRLIRIENRDAEKPFLKTLFYFLLHQAKIMLAMLKLIKRKEVDVFIFSFGSVLFIFPMLLGRLYGKKVILRIECRPSIKSKEYHKETNKYKILLFATIEKLTYLVAHEICLEFEYMVERYNLQKYQYKISVWSLYIPPYFLKETKKLTERMYQIGYVGSFFEFKGILEFAASLSLILKNNQSRAIIMGSGDLEDEIEEIFVNNNIQNKVELRGWIENKELPRYLNDMKIVVVPSYYEGLPNIVLESMACGCIVVATPVGGIPDVIKDGETGFIMENNSPECIAKNVIRALEYPNLDEIVENARKLIEKEYTYEAAVERYREILENI